METHYWIELIHRHWHIIYTSSRYRATKALLLNNVIWQLSLSTLSLLEEISRSLFLPANCGLIPNGAQCVYHCCFETELKRLPQWLPIKLIRSECSIVYWCLLCCCSRCYSFSSVCKQRCTGSVNKRSVCARSCILRCLPAANNSTFGRTLPALVCKQQPLQALVLGLDPPYRALILAQRPVHRVQDVAHCGSEDLIQRGLQEHFQVTGRGHVGPGGWRRLGAIVPGSKCLDHLRGTDKRSMCVYVCVCVCMCVCMCVCCCCCRVRNKQSTLRRRRVTQRRSCFCFPDTPSDPQRLQAARGAAAELAEAPLDVTQFTQITTLLLLIFCV